VARYEELVEHPARIVERIYADLGLEMTPELERRLADEEKRAQEYRAEHVYSLEEYGLTRAAIRGELAPLFERFGWGD
jgi:hypothetical protein